MNNTLRGIIIRYTTLVILGILGNLAIFYIFLTPITAYPVWFILNLFYDVILIDNVLLVQDYAIELIPACIAAAAYYLLLILNLSTPMDKKTRLYSLIYSLLALLIINILRIVLLSTMFLNNMSYFDFTHKLFWNALSTIIVVAIWFSAVKIYKIKAIPIYTDIIFLKKQIKK